MRLRVQTTSEQQTIALGERLAGVLQPGDVIALHGELGAGKTRFVRGVASGLGVDPSIVSSPTYIIMQEYPCGAGMRVQSLIHVDAYRLGAADELETIGWDRIAAELEQHGPVVALIEWAERIATALPSGAERLDVRLEHQPNQVSRAITIEGSDAWTSRPGWERLATFGATTRPPRPPTTCPITGKPVSPDSPTYPFFDERARLADLGKWLSGSYQVSRDIDPEEDTDTQQ